MRPWFAICALAVAASAAAAVPPSQRDALITFYNATGGSSWTDNRNWLGPAGSECTWNGVQCDDAQSNVVELNLYDNNLKGTIPPAISGLPGLRVLSIWQNSLSGPIPTQIGSLTNLESIMVDNNLLSGPIPQSIGSLAKLKQLEADGNALTGPLPRELGNLAALEELTLHTTRSMASCRASWVSSRT